MTDYPIHLWARLVGEGGLKIKGGSDGFHHLESNGDDFGCGVGDRKGDGFGCRYSDYIGDGFGDTDFGNGTGNGRSR